METPSMRETLTPTDAPGITVKSPETKHTAGKKPQSVTRVPEWRPGRWVKLRDTAPVDLRGAVRQVRSLTCSITTADQEAAIWRIHFSDGRCVQVCSVEREATDAEIEQARKQWR